QWLDTPDADQLPYCLAFSRDGRTVAVGSRAVPAGAFYREGAGVIWLFTRDGNGWAAARKGPAVSYRPEKLAFDPTDANRPACAGGGDNEVTLWHSRPPGRPVSVVRSPGSSLWGVAFAADGKRLGFQDRRAALPDHPNHWGAGPYRVFDLDQRKLLPPGRGDFRPVPPRTTVAGWRMETDPTDGRLWTPVGPAGRRVPADPARRRLHG